MPITIAVIGNPNVGKTTLFNALTGLSQVTGNYPGVTVERKIGTIRLNGSTAHLVDLPGTYSLAARSPDEMIVVDVLLSQQTGEDPVDAVLAVVDATNLERNLYLVSQLKELGKPLVVALNMCDLADKRNIAIDTAVLSAELGAPVVRICAHKRVGIDELKTTLTRVIHEPIPPASKGPEFPGTLNSEVDALAQLLNDDAAGVGRHVPRLEVFRLLVDRGGYVEERITRGGNGISHHLEDSRQRASQNGSLAAVEARERYAWIRRVVAAGVVKPKTRATTSSDKIDAVLTHPIVGTLIFGAIMTVIFQAIFSWAGPLMDLIDKTFVAAGELAATALPEGMLQSLVQDGIIAGVGNVIIFLPQILVLMLFIAILEDCGYMARAAFLMDKLLSRCGLSGQSFIPMLSSFACAIPGVMATRTIGNRRDRITTILVAPLMSCSARLPVYTLMITAFIPETMLFGGWLNLQGIVLFAMYSVGIVVAIPVAWILKRTLLKGETPPFLLELPTYKLPLWGTIARRVYRHGKEFVVRAGTIIFAVIVIVWALAYFPHSGAITQQFDEERGSVGQAAISDDARAAALTDIDNKESAAHLRNSYFGRMGLAVEPVVRPLGWDWRIGMAAIASFPAREVIIATLGTIFALGSDVDEESESLKSYMQGATGNDGTKLFNIPVALSIMVFFALCCQCGATLAVIRRETQSIRWPVFAFSYMTILAYIAALLTYQAGMWAGWGANV
ncbi:MAG: ferrous iron transport protein B [Candidatus Hydrogenedentes bacterium]|nr:ferrous iron transport protein B [Candidatus Hydrogenedentota bacterium]